ncbi:hypothetical protein [Francisella uliginis]|nr:hypothetical protein [Francisella uliginis]
MKDPSFIYRCENLSLALESIGSKVTICHISELPFLLNSSVDVIVFHRPSYSWKLSLVVKIASKKRTLCIADFDDLIFDYTWAKYSPAVINGILSLKKVRKMYTRNKKALQLFKICTFSTKPLMDKCDYIFPKIKKYLLTNSFHYNWLGKSFEESKLRIKKITYFPGTKSHDKDLLIVEKILADFINKYSDVELHICGAICQTQKLMHKRIFFYNKVSFGEYYKRFKNIWLNIAPLEITPFTECKSALKVIEAAYFNAPTLCSDIWDNRRFVDSGAIIAKDLSEWKTLLDMLYKDKRYYKYIVNNLRSKIIEKANIYSVATSLNRFVSKELSMSKYKKGREKYFHKIAVNKRNAGEYSLKTLELYKKAYIHRKSFNRYIDYCVFRRDLGYHLNERQYNNLVKKNYKINYKYDQIVRDLKNEFEKCMNEEKNINFLNDISYAKNICVVGNALIKKDLNEYIDAHEFVIRFNDWFDGFNKFRGNKIDIWVCSPAFRDRDLSRSSKWRVISGPQVLYKESVRKLFLGKKKLNTIDFPLYVWKYLVKLCGSPPSSGIMMLYYLFCIRGSWNEISAVGFDLDLDKESYHFSSAEYMPSERHNWVREKEILKSWQGKGLLFV